ncbi:hypothetical protein AO392_13035 [Pseudomonas putida]|uniref:hypothetical protein n=1 Tax=Pseudomonas TaxID=286 RepID=UPI000731933E|nr:MULTISPECIES: hypothetical protein [Pseudomonas]KTC25158.1 hypothetical protein AO392_13035 [Pseudomonas putida]WKL65203.1 hypothetical protein Q1Z72_18080 [Pseudomonas qingdaonensis]
MKPTDTKQGDKVPRPLSSDQAQKGTPSPDPVLEQPDPDTEAVDKVITPTSIKEQEEKTHEIQRRLAEAQGKG